MRVTKLQLMEMASRLAAGVLANPVNNVTINESYLIQIALENSLQTVTQVARNNSWEVVDG